MIFEQDLTVVGAVHKTHGIMGEMTCSFDSDVDFETIDFVVLNVDGIFVPFFIDSYRGKKSGSMILKFEGIDSEEDAKNFIGFALEDKGLGFVGVIDDVDDTTENVLFVLGDKLIPVVTDFIEEIDHDRKILYTHLPDGLLEL